MEPLIHGMGLGVQTPSKLFDKYETGNKSGQKLTKPVVICMWFSEERD